MPHSLSRPNFILIAIVALAAFFRLYQLDRLPPGLEFDVAFKVFDVLRLLQGQFSIFFPAYTGREPLFHYLSMPYVALFGPTALALKLCAAVIGIATVPLLYGFTRTLFQSTRVASLAALFCAISVWHIFFSRVGYRVILLVPLTILMFWCLWRAIEDKHWRDYALAGLFAGLALYTYPSARVFSIALLVIVCFMVMTDRDNARTYIKGMALLLIVTALVFLPLGVYFVLHPDEFLSHPADVSIFAPRGDKPVDLASALGGNALRLFGMFFVAGDSGALRNIPSRPVFDPLLGLLFLCGAVILVISLLSPRVAAVQRRCAVLLTTWLLLGFGISLLSDDAPNFSRMLFVLPVIMILPAWACFEVWDRLGTPIARRLAPVGLAAVVLVSTGLSFRDYFLVFANDPGTYYTFDVDKVETGEWINQKATSLHLYLAPLWSQNGTISLLTRLAPLKSFESRDTIVLPSAAGGKDALFGFPFEQERKVQTMATRLGALGVRDELTSSNGGKLLLLYRVPASNLPGPDDPLAVLERGGEFVRPQKRDRVVWDGKIALLGYTVSPEGPGGRNLTVTLFLQALEPMQEDYTISLKVRDNQGRVWGQEDKWPGDNSYATTQWSPGDLIIEKFYPGLSACAPAGEYQATVEAYNPKTGQVLALTNSPQTVVSLGTLSAGASQGNRLEDLEPDQVVDKPVNSRLDLIGYTLSSDKPSAGTSFSLSLFWKGSSQEGGEKVAVRLRDASKRDVQLTETMVKLPGDGRGLCTYFDFSLPGNIESGEASLWVNDLRLAGMSLTR